MTVAKSTARALAEAINDELDDGTCWGFRAEVRDGPLRVVVRSTSRARRFAGTLVIRADGSLGDQHWRRQRGHLSAIVKAFEAGRTSLPGHALESTPTPSQPQQARDRRSTTPHYGVTTMGISIKRFATLTRNIDMTKAHRERLEKKAVAEGRVTSRTYKLGDSLRSRGGVKLPTHILAERVTRGGLRVEDMPELLLEAGQRCRLYALIDRASGRGGWLAEIKRVDLTEGWATVVGSGVELTPRIRARLDEAIAGTADARTLDDLVERGLVAVGRTLITAAGLARARQTQPNLETVRLGGAS